MQDYREIDDLEIQEKVKIAFARVRRVGDKVVDFSCIDDDGFPEQTQDILDQLEMLPSITGFSPREIRQMRKRAGSPYDHDRDVNVKRRDFNIPGPSSFIPARIYYPSSENSGKLSGALVFYHGGGFVLGDIDSYDGVTSQLAGQSGLIVVSIGYRLAPETPFPGGLLDAQHAFNWLYDNAENYRIDRERMAIGGDSAGGNLSAVVCILNRDEGKAKPALQMLIYPSTIGNCSSKSRIRFHDAPVLPKRVLEWLHNHYISEDQENDPRFNALATDDFSDLPPAFVMTAGYDPLLDEGEAYAKKLQAHGVSVRYSCYANMFHGFYNFGVLPESKIAIKESADILAVALG